MKRVSHGQVSVLPAYQEHGAGRGGSRVKSSLVCNTGVEYRFLSSLHRSAGMPPGYDQTFVHKSSSLSQSMAQPYKNGSYGAGEMA